MIDGPDIPTEGGEDPPEEGAPELFDGSADSFFAALMGTLEDPASDAEDAQGGGLADPAPGGDGQPAAPGEGSPAGADGAAPPAAGAGGQPDVAPPESGFTRDATEFDANWGAAIEGLETRQREELTYSAVEAVKTEYSKYIEIVDQAPRYLVGKTVPKADGSGGDERLNDAQDARDWQDEIKKQLATEVNRRIQIGTDENRGQMELLHNSIELFRGNPDLVPNTKQFDKELADEFATMIEPYAVKTVAGKVAGWSIDVKPLLKVARTTVTSRRAVASVQPPAPSGPTAQQQRAGQQPRNAQQQFTQTPQAGIPSSAGQSGDEGENLDVLFGSLGIAPGTFRF